MFSERLGVGQSGSLPPTNITFYSEGGEEVVCGLERRGEGTWPTVQTVFISPLTVRVCHRPSQWQPLFVCGRKHGHFFLLEVSCLVWGRLALPAVGGRFVVFVLFFFYISPTTLLAFVLPFESSKFHPAFRETMFWELPPQ